MSPRPSLLDVVQDILATPTPPPSQAHPFSNSASSLSSKLLSVLDTTSQLSYALTQLSAMPTTNQTPKLVSLMKQHAAISASIAVSRAATASLAHADRRVVFPDTAPPSPSRLAEWGRTAGMEAFVDSSGGLATTTVVLAGKVLVLDVDIDGHVAVKASFAVGNNIPTGAHAAPDLDAFLVQEVSRWVNAAKRASSSEVYHDAVDPAVEAAVCAHSLQDHLRYLMMLDSLAASEGERGIRWFMEPLTAYRHFSSAFGVCNLAGSKTSVDKRLAYRALPMNYFDSPSLSFLVWLSPLAYHQFNCSLTPEQLRATGGPTDISSSYLVAFLLKNLEYATIATLKLVPSPDISSAGALPDGPSDHTFPTAPSHSWILDFSSSRSGQHSGIVMSQTRMRAIQGVLGIDMTADMLMDMGAPAGASVGPGLGNIGSFGSMSGMSQLGFNGLTSTSQTTSIGSPGLVGSSWVDLLFNVGSSAEHYKATCRSPNSSHPPVNLRLSSPQEAGFLLQRVPVRTASQVSRILEIVKEQCWLNELLLILQWQPENMSSFQRGEPQPSLSTAITPEIAEDSGNHRTVSEGLLASLLAGSISPTSIPVSVYLPSTSPGPLVPSHVSSSASSQFSFGTLGPPPGSGGSSGADSIFGAGDIDMDMEIPGLSMSMNSASMDIGISSGMGMGIGMSGIRAMGMELSGSGSPPRPPPIIILSIPARPPRMGHIELRISFVQTNSPGTGTAVGGNNGDCNVKVESLPGIDTRGMDEVVRRGGIWGLPGRVWARGYK